MGIPELAVMAYIVLTVVLTATLVIWPGARICRRLGFSPWLALLMLVPVGNVVLLWVAAYAPWPIENGRRAT